MKNLHKNRKKIENEAEFCRKLDLIFDIAHADAEALTENSEDILFLASQRDGLKGYMAWEDKDWVRCEEQKKLREK